MYRKIKINLNNLFQKIREGYDPIRLRKQSCPGVKNIDRREVETGISHEMKQKVPKKIWKAEFNNV